MVGHIAPLNQKPPTTIFMHPFYPSILQSLQYFLKTHNSPISNPSNSGRQSLDFRSYVAQPWCKPLQYQPPSLSCSRPKQRGNFFFFNSMVAISFCIFWGPPILTTYIPYISPTIFLLILTFLRFIPVSMVGLWWVKILEMTHRNWFYLYPEKPP